jgi:hypothetical protein
MHKVPAKRIGDALAPRGIVDHEGIAVASGVISGGRGAPEAAASALTIRSSQSEVSKPEALTRDCGRDTHYWAPPAQNRTDIPHPVPRAAFKERLRWLREMALFVGLKPAACRDGARLAAYGDGLGAAVSAERVRT